MAFGLRMSSHSQTLPQFIVFFAVLVGGGLGLGYTSTMEAAWKWLPKSKGLITGAILSGYGCGGFFLNLYGTRLINPRNLNPENGLFPAEVSENFSDMLRTLSICFVLVTCASAFLITNPNKSHTEPRKSEENINVNIGVNVVDALKSRQFCLLWIMLICSACAGLNASAVFKQFASIHPHLRGNGCALTYIHIIHMYIYLHIYMCI